MKQAPLSVLDRALAFLKRGFSIVPIKPDGSKKPTIAWKEFQTRLMTEAEARRHFSNGVGIGAVCGKVSGGLEALDFEDLLAFEEWREAVGRARPALLAKLPGLLTPGGGRHEWLRSGAPEGGMKLARSLDTSRGKEGLLVESRGEGNYVVTLGSPAACHESGKVYEHDSSTPSLLLTPTITIEERDFLFHAARALNEVEEKPRDCPPPREEPGATGGTLRPGDDYNRRATWPEVLEPHGWRIDHVGQDGLTYWTRPGKDRGTSATTGARRECGGADLLHVFTSNAPPLKVDESYSRFCAFAVLEHGGDFVKAARALKARGYGRETEGTRPHAEPVAAALVGLDEPFPEPPAAEAYHGLAGEFARAVAEHVESDPVALLTTFLGLFGAAIGPGSCAMAGDDEHPARLYVALVGRTARARKGSSWNPARKRLESVDPAWGTTSILSGLASGEGLINAVRDSKDGEPAGTKHIAVFEPELARVLQAARREGSTLSAVIRDCWDRQNLRVMTRGNPLCASGAHVAIVAHITRDELLKDVDAQAISNGFANRFIWSAAKRAQILPHACGSSKVEWGDFDKRLKAAVEFGRQRRLLEWDKKGAGLWEEVYRELAEDDPPGRLGAVLARAEAQVLRLTVAYSLLDRSPVLTVPALEAAMALWTYAASSARWAFGSGGVGGADGLRVEQRALVTWISQRGGKCTVRQLVGSGPRRYRGKTEESRNALHELVNLGLGRWDPHAGSRAPSELFGLNPTLETGNGNTFRAPPQEYEESVSSFQFPGPAEPEPAPGEAGSRDSLKFMLTKAGRPSPPSYELVTALRHVNPKTSAKSGGLPDNDGESPAETGPAPPAPEPGEDDGGSTGNGSRFRAGPREYEESVSASSASSTAEEDPGPSREPGEDAAEEPWEVIA